MTTLDADVIVVGCGPVGAMAALRCAQHGLSVICIDKDVEIYPLPRAISLDHEGQRLFETAGLGEQLRANSTPMAGAEFLDRHGERVVGFELPPGHLTALGHPMMVSFEQPQLEADLRAAAQRAGVDMRLGVEAIDLSHDDSICLATSESELTSRWLIGADGASSWVRTATEIRLEDQGFDQTWLVVDAMIIDPDVDLPRVAQQRCSPERVITVVPGHANRRRWEFQLNIGETREQMLNPATITSLLEPWGGPDQLRVDRAAVYRFHALVAEQFRNGAVFLAGDAAHQMPPFQGQGLNSGLRDADNLAWKLALVQQGSAGDELLDTYDIERRPHAIGIVEHSCDTGRLMDAIAAGKPLNSDAGYGGGRPFPHLESGALDGTHPSIGKPVPQPTIDGVRLDELLSNSFGLLTRRPINLPERWAAVGARQVTIGDGLLPPGLLEDDEVVVVRPDRYVAAVTRDLSGCADRLLARSAAE